MGFTQWALASTKPPHLKAMAVALSTSERSFSWYPGGSLALEVIIPWDLGALQFNKPTGKGMDTQVCHVWDVQGGKVTRFQQSVDTAKLHETMEAASD